MNKQTKCIKCGEDIEQDGMGWEHLEFPYGDGIDLIQISISICPNCIGKFQHVIDIQEYNKKEFENYSNMFMPLITKLVDIHSEIHKINDSAKG